MSKISCLTKEIINWHFWALHFFKTQVGKLYIRYQLDVSESDEAVVELQDVICLLKDEKELYIQKDHLSCKLDICRCVFVMCV